MGLCLTTKTQDKSLEHLLCHSNTELDPNEVDDGDEKVIMRRMIRMRG